MPAGQPAEWRKCRKILGCPWGSKIGRWTASMQGKAHARDMSCRLGGLRLVTVLYRFAVGRIPKTPEKTSKRTTPLENRSMSGKLPLGKAFSGFSADTICCLLISGSSVRVRRGAVKSARYKRHSSRVNGGGALEDRRVSQQILIGRKHLQHRNASLGVSSSEQRQLQADGLSPESARFGRNLSVSLRPPPFRVNRRFGSHQRDELS
jgi:hypothetical protein